MSCNRCDELMSARLISTPVELTKAIRFVHEKITDGRLALIETRDFGPEGRILDVSEGGPWKEFLRIRLKCCACQLLFDHSLCGDLSAWSEKARATVA